MATPIIMPKQGQSVESCVIIEWKKKKGDTVNQGDILFTFETDKAVFEFESPVSGVLLDTYFNAEDDVPVLTTVAVIGEPGENTEEFKPAPTSTTDAAETQPSPESPAPTAEGTLINSSPVPELVACVSETVKSGVASPRARNKAQERGIDLSTINGTGPQNRIIERDVLTQPGLTKTAAARLHAEDLASPQGGSGIGGRVRASDLVTAKTPTSTEDTFSEITPSHMRKIIGTRMLQSVQQSAQLTMHAHADATVLLAYRKQVKARSKDLDLPDITITDLIALAVARTLPSFLELNSLYKDGKIFRYDHVHLAVAVDTPRGLMVPVVRFADLLPVGNLSSAIKDLTRQCREGSINPDHLTGGTITVSNLGMFGIESFTPILNPPQVAILGINAITPKPHQTDNGDYIMRPTIGFSLTIDHQIVDGAPGARFLKALCDNITHIDFMLTVWQ